MLHSDLIRHTLPPVKMTVILGEFEMASLKYHKDVKRWRVFWHVTLPDGTVDKGSRSFKGRPDGERFKEKKEREEKLLKRAIFVQAPLMSDVLDEWKDHLQRHTVRTRELYEYGLNDFLQFLPENVIFMTDLSTNHVNRYINSLMSKGLKNKSINNNLCALKSLCRYARKIIILITLLSVLRN